MTFVFYFRKKSASGTTILSYLLARVYWTADQFSPSKYTLVCRRELVEAIQVAIQVAFQVASIDQKIHSPLYHKMTKQLLVMRHAKSSWNVPGVTDFQRPLNDRGWRDTPRMAELVGQQGCVPDLIASSSAVRARQTAELFAEHCSSDKPIPLVMVDAFYLAPASTYLKFLTELANLPEREPATVMVVGHNPGLEELVQILSGSHEHFPTAAIAKFRVDVACWGEFNRKRCEIEFLWRPKEVLS